MLYGLGAAAESIIGVAFNVFNFFFYTNIMGIPGTLAGLAITIALVFDAVTGSSGRHLIGSLALAMGASAPVYFAAPLSVIFCLFLI
jgi:glycoside/pentoside/hexuronide:cation symporter, GPH family